jgi:hypothetical protein
VKCCVFFAVRTRFVNIIQTIFGFKGTSTTICDKRLIEEWSSTPYLPRNLVVMSGELYASCAVSSGKRPRVMP